MKAKQAILDLWQFADRLGVVITFRNVYGDSTGAERYRETLDAFGREDDVRIVKSCWQLYVDTPSHAPTFKQSWPGYELIREIMSHRLDEDYTASTRVASGTRDPLVNMYSEKVTEDNVVDDVEPCDDPYNAANLNLESDDV